MKKYPEQEYFDQYPRKVSRDFQNSTPFNSSVKLLIFHMKEAHPTTCFPIRNKKLNKFLLSSIITSKEVILRPTGQWTHVQQKASGMGKKNRSQKETLSPNCHLFCRCQSTAKLCLRIRAVEAQSTLPRSTCTN